MAIDYFRYHKMIVRQSESMCLKGMLTLPSRHHAVCTYQCISPPPPLGEGWAMKSLPHYGTFDNHPLSAQGF